MNASAYVGRIGGLAVALGVGAAVFTGGGTAWNSTRCTGLVRVQSADDGSDSGPVRKKALKAAGAGTAPTPRGVDGLKDLADSIADRAARPRRTRYRGIPSPCRRSDRPA